MEGNNEFDDELAGSGGSGNMLQTLLRDYIPYWPVVVAAAIIGYISAKVYLRYQRPVYEVNASLLIKDDSKSTDNLVKTAVLGQGSTTIEDQIELLKSSKVMQRAADKVNAYFHYEWEGQFNNYFDYKNTMPFQIRAVNPDSIVPFRGKINFAPEKNGVVVNSVFYPFNKQVQIGGNSVVVTPNSCSDSYLKNWLKFPKIWIKIISKDEAAGQLKSTFEVAKNK